MQNRIIKITGNKMNTLIKKTISGFLLLGLSVTLNADDIDLIDFETMYDTNVLFVMDLSGSMNGDIAGVNNPAVAPDPSRLDELKGAFQNIVNDPEFDDVNFGLSVFSGVKTAGDSAGKDVAHGITYPIGPVLGTVETAQQILNRNPLYNHPGVSPYISYMPVVPAPATTTTRDYLGLLSSNWVASGKTPIVDALYEAARYFRAQGVYFGYETPDDIRAAHPSSYIGELTDVTITSACTLANRLGGRTCGSADPTEIVDNPNGILSWTSVDNGDAACVSSTRLYCPEVPVGDAAPSCGTHSGCTGPTVRDVDRYCPLTVTTIPACIAWGAAQTNSPVYGNCTINNIPDPDPTHCTPDGEGGLDCPTIPQVKCVEKFHRLVCDKNPTISCPVRGPTCSVCPPPVVTTVVDGTATYKSPITGECPKNGIVLLSDGKPTGTPRADLVTAMIGPSYAGSCDSGSFEGRCGPQLAKYLASIDHAPSVPGVQNVVTFTVGLALGTEDSTDPTDPTTYLKTIASQGGGAFVTANDRASLTAAFKLAITSVARKARSFSSPSYSINTSTLLSHSGFVYVPVFDRGAIVWPGNLKKFKLINDVLTDLDGNPATDAHGALLDTAKDFWATGASVNAITSGGAANKINPATRKLFTDNNATGTAANLQSLTASVSKTLLGNPAMTDAYRLELIKYMRGFESNGTTPRHHMGDIIHSKPVQLDIAGGRKVVFVGSNEGYLHAINDADGSEAFAYMPSDLLKNADKQFSGTATAKHIYGVDSPITLWIDEHASAGSSSEGNGILDPGESAYLFFGLRRGGDSYHALNITDPDNPVLEWKINNLGGNANSWSQPVVAPLQYKNGESGLNSIAHPSPVLVFGGGYNEDASGNEISNIGNAVFIVDVATGKKIWSTRVAEASLALAPDSIDNPVPSRIRVIDVDRNGSIDRLYFGDTGGNIWRVDLNAGNFSGIPTQMFDISKAKLHKLAELGSRKFFEEPDVAIFKHAGKLVATIAIGSGDRTKPITVPAVANRFFVLYDKEVLALPTKPTVTLGQLTASTALTGVNILDPAFYGWYKTLTSTTGEKVLAPALTYQNKVMFTTFGTTSITPDACNPSNINQARLYVMDLLSGSLYRNEAETSGEILGTPQIIFKELQAHDGSACVKGDCERPAVIRVGRVGPIDLPPVPAGVAAPDVFPRVYWIDNEQ